MTITLHTCNCYDNVYIFIHSWLTNCYVYSVKKYLSSRFSRCFSHLELFSSRHSKRCSKFIENIEEMFSLYFCSVCIFNYIVLCYLEGKDHISRTAVRIIWSFPSRKIHLCIFLDWWCFVMFLFWDLLELFQYFEKCGMLIN